jgi:hypothetical protein
VKNKIIVPRFHLGTKKKGHSIIRTTEKAKSDHATGEIGTI